MKYKIQTIMKAKLNTKHILHRAVNFMVVKSNVSFCKQIILY